MKCSITPEIADYEFKLKFIKSGLGEIHQNGIVISFQDHYAFIDIDHIDSNNLYRIGLALICHDKKG